MVCIDAAYLSPGSIASLVTDFFHKLKLSGDKTSRSGRCWVDRWSGSCRKPARVAWAPDHTLRKSKNPCIELGIYTWTRITPVAGSLLRTDQHNGSNETTLAHSMPSVGGIHRISSHPCDLTVRFGLFVLLASDAITQEPLQVQTYASPFC